MKGGKMKAYCLRKGVFCVLLFCEEYLSAHQISSLINLILIFMSKEMKLD